MSQFPAQIAFTPATQGARRNLPVDVPAGTGIPAIQPATGGAPGLPGVAALPAPVPDLSAARDLEQALRATQALGNTLVDVGNALNIQRQIDDRKSVYDARLRFEKDSLKFEEEYAAGKYNGQIDATDDAQAFVDNWSTRYVDPSRTSPVAEGEQLTAGEAEYRERMGKLAGTAWVRRRAERQKIELTNDLRAVHVGLVDPTSVGPRQGADDLWQDFSRRYPGLDRATFMEASYGKALEALAKAGDEDGFNQVAAMVPQGDDSVLIVDPLRETLRGAVRNRVAEQLSAAATALKEAKESSAPFLSRYSQLRDRLDSLVDDDGARQETLVDFFSDEIKGARSRGDMEAADKMATMTLGPDALQDFRSRKAAMQVPMLTKEIKALASDPTPRQPGEPTFAELVAEYGDMIDPDDLEAAKDSWVRNFKAYRRSLAVTEYMKTGDRGKIVSLMDAALDAWNPEAPAWSQIEGAMDGEEWLDIDAKLNEVDKKQADSNMVADVLSGRTRITSPTDPKFDVVLNQTGAIRNGKIGDPAVAAELVVRLQTVPARMLDAMYGDLRGTKEDKERALRFMSGIAPVLYDSESASQINGWKMSDADSAANQASVRAIESILPTLATLNRDATGAVSDQDISVVAQSFEAALERWQDAQVPAYDAKRFEDQLRGANVSTILGISTTDPQTNTVTVNSTRNAIKTAIANDLSKDGLDPTAAAELADIASVNVMRDSVPAIGNVGLSRSVMEDRVRAESAAVRERFHLPRIAGRGFPAPVERTVAPNANWDEAWAGQALEQMGIKPESVTHVMPAMGEGNSWWLLLNDAKVDPRTKKTVTGRKFVRIDGPMPQRAVPETSLTIDERVRRARERATRRSPAMPTPAQLRDTALLPFTFTP